MHNFSWNQISFSKGLVEVDGILHPKVGIDEDLEKLLAEDPGLYLDSRPAANAVAGLVTDSIHILLAFHRIEHSIRVCVIIYKKSLGTSAPNASHLMVSLRISGWGIVRVPCQLKKSL